MTSVMVLLLAGCQGDGSPNKGANGEPGTTNNAPSLSAAQETSGGRALVYIGGEPIDWHSLQPSLIEAYGGQVLAELVLDRMVTQRLAQQGIVIESAQLEAEKAIFIDSMGGDNPDESHRLLQAMRRRRGLGERRLALLLKRNAGLRLLVQDEVEISDMAIDQAYRFEYGPRYEARLIVAGSLQEAADLVRRARGGESFVDLVVAHSQDASRAQGGLIGPISPVDATYPQAVRAALQSLQPGEVADPVALDDGFAVLRLERKIDGPDVALEDVRDELALRVRRRVERMLMQRLARAMLAEADVIVLDPALHESWKHHSRALLEGAR